MEVVDVLNEVKELLSDEHRWTQGAMARDKKQLKIKPLSDEATCWCLYGAIAKVSGGFHTPICTKTYYHLRGQNDLLSDFNDCSITDHSDIIRFIDDAILRCDTT